MALPLLGEAAFAEYLFPKCTTQGVLAFDRRVSLQAFPYSV
jgi:hypothetical protein